VGEVAGQTCRGTAGTSLASHIARRTSYAIQVITRATETLATTEVAASKARGAISRTYITRKTLQRTGSAGPHILKCGVLADAEPSCIAHSQTLACQAAIVVGTRTSDTGIVAGHAE